LYGFRRIETPAFEATELFVRGVGVGTDIVEKEMFDLEVKGVSKGLTLRPEGTAPVVRAYLEHGMHTWPHPLRLYYLGSMFRYDRPQAGRYRQFHQFGYEVFGDPSPALDAEVIELSWRIHLQLGLGGLTLQLNSVGCPVCRPEIRLKLVEYYQPLESKLCPDCRRRLTTNPMRMFDCKVESCQPFMKDAPKALDSLCPECRDHFEQVQASLKLVGLPFVVNPLLVRGLDYYTKTAFEIWPTDVVGQQNSLGGGGRYDVLVELLGGKPTPAIGYAGGMERIVAALKRQHLKPPSQDGFVVFVVTPDPKDLANKFTFLAKSRQAGLAAGADFSGKKMGRQLELASKLGVKFCLIAGEEELKAGKVIIRNMEKAVQEAVAVEEVEGYLKKKMSPSP